MIYLFYNWKFVSLKLITHFTHPPSSSATTILLSASVISALFCSALLSCVQISHVSGVIWHLPFFDISLSMTPFVWVCARSLQSCLTLCDSMDYSPPGSSVHGILQTRYWRGLPCPPPRDLPNPGIEPRSPAAPVLQADSLLLTRWRSP